MLRLITGSALSQAPGQAVRTMVTEATANTKDKYIIIVPEQFTLQTQKQVVKLHPQHACMNIDVVSFDRLARVVLAKLGRDISEILDDVGKALILRKVLEDSADELVVYGSKIHQAGFIEEVKSLITEFKQYGIDDNTLYLMQNDAAAKGNLLVSKLSDIRLIYSRFNDVIADKYTTAEEVLDIFARCLGESDFMKNSHVFLEGFTGFTPIQYRLLKKMLEVTADITCSVILPERAARDDCPDYEMFYLANDTCARLKALAADMHAELQEIRCTDCRNVPEVRVVPCAGPKEEAEYVAGQIRRLVRTEGLRYRDIAVLASDMEEYYRPVSSVMKAAEIPAFIDYKTEFSGNLLVRFILSALEIAAGGLNYDNMFTFLKCGLSGIEADEMAQLENYALEFNIRGRNRWEKDFTANRTLHDDFDAWNLGEINEIRRKAQPVVKFYARTGSGKRMAALLCRHLTTLMDEYNVEQAIAAKAEAYIAEGDLALGLQYEQIYGKVKELIEKVEMLMGSEKVTAREFAGIIESGVNEIRIGIIPPSVDSLTVGDLTRTRLGDVSHIFVMGVNDGKIPSAGSGSALFTQKEREFLRRDYEIAPTVLENICTQRYYLYLAFNKPQKELTLTYAAMYADGSEAGPSCIFKDMDEIMAGPAQITEGSASEGDLWRGRGTSLLADIVRCAADSVREDAVPDAVGDRSAEGVCEESDEKGLLNEDKALAEYFAAAEPEVLRRLVRGAVFTNRQSMLDKQTALDLYGGILKGSVSRYETFYMCPYRHFLNYGLRLEKRREYEVQATDLGTIYHDTLEKYFNKVKEEGFSYREIGDDDSHRIVADCTEEAIAGIGNDILSSSARNENLKSRIKEITERTTDVLREHVKAGLFEPEEFELPFDEKLSENVLFRGKIDRVDIYDGGDLYVKIIDYKSGQKQFNIMDIYAGVQLQLVAYMNSAVREIGRRFPGRNVVPGGVYYYLVGDKYVKPGEEESKNKMSGVTLAEDNVIKAVDTSLESQKNSDIIPVEYKKDGTFAAKSIVAARAEFTHLINFVNEKIEYAGREIQNGDIALRPYKRGSSHDGCTFCDYKDICKFDDGAFGSDWREVKEDKKEAEEAVYGRDHME